MNWPYSKILITLSLMLLITTSSSAVEEVKAQELSQALSPVVKKILKKYQFKDDQLIYSFQNLDDGPNGKDRTSHQENVPFIPASLTKIFSALYALKNLGADYQFKTSLFYKGKITGEVLTGDLYLKGSGDPSLTMARLMDLAMDLRAKGIKKITGNFFFDESELPTISALSEFGNGDQTYNPGVSALNLEYNRITLFREGGQRTKRANFVPMPPMNHMQIEKTKETFPLGTRYRFREQAGGEVWEVSERESYNLYEDIPIRRPSRRTAETFRVLTELWGISLPPARAGILPNGATVIGTDKSPPLIRLLAMTLEYSNNLFAETILLKAAQKTSIPEAAKELSSWLKENIKSCDKDLVNGSGLTSEHQVRASCFVDFLNKFAVSPVAKRGFMSLLSINGQSGWLRTRLRHPETNFRIWAKTGSLDYVSNMAGVLFTLSGKRYAFALSLQDRQKRDLIDAALEAEREQGNNPLARKSNRLKKRAMAWSRQAKGAADELLEHFIRTL
jgi:D-alanyl-D-alanine carboxypeptidase/D-alanyl-D-alanine-endopeptidase (penicillin-binding protein 4)